MTMTCLPWVLRVHWTCEGHALDMRGVTAMALQSQHLLLLVYNRNMLHSFAACSCIASAALWLPLSNKAASHLAALLLCKCVLLCGYLSRTF